MTTVTQPVRRVLFRNANVFDGVNAALSPATNVLVEGNEIRWVGREAMPADGAEVVDCAGRTLMPGLIDCHTHVYADSLRALTLPEGPATYRAQYANVFLGHILDCGFTSIRDVAGGDRGLAMALRDGYVRGPRYFYGGKALSQTGGHGDLRTPDTQMCACCSGSNWASTIADGEDECRKAVREELRQGANHIKIMGSGGVMSPSDPLHIPQYSEGELRVIVEECDRRGVYACAHCHPAAAVRRCVECGVRCIEHGTLIDGPTADFVAEKGAFIVPTMATIQALADDGQKLGIPAASYEKLLAVLDHAVKGLEIMKAAGVKMGFGTDLLGSQQHQRQGTEFTIRRQVLSSADILVSATSINADILQMKDRLGVVKPGALADLIVVDGNPVENIEVLAAPRGEKLTHIMRDGAFVKINGVRVVD